MFSIHDRLEDESGKNFKFGILLAIVFSFIAIYLFDLNHYLSICFVFLAVFCLLLSIYIPKFFVPILKLWITFGDFLGKIISPITLAFIFFCILTPIGLLGRLLGRDELRLKHHKCTTHWIFRSESQVSKESFKNQY